MVLPALAAAGITAAGSAIGGYLAKPNTEETPMQRQRRKLVDELLSSLRGQGGAYRDLFATNESDFQKGFVEPALSRFNNQIAPQIQQQFIQSGLQRGTGLDDTLTRAGVDLNNMINENYLNFQNQGLQRKQNLLSQILQGSEAGPQMSGAQAAGQGFAGYLSSSGFGNTIENAFKPNPPAPVSYDQTRVGYSPSWSGNPGYGGPGKYNFQDFQYRM